MTFLFSALIWGACCSLGRSIGPEFSKSLDWWQTEVIYQIYPRSFKDSNGDGIGDLNGLYTKLSYIKELGVGAIWLSPVMESPMVDFGYDISNYRRIDPSYGTMEDFDKFLKRAQGLGLKILMDFVPNHTSNKHEWFAKSVKRIAPYSDYYVWKDAKYVNGKRSPPNNWLSYLGNSAWEWNEERRQYYLHQFTVQQPDLNYRNPSVYEEMKNVLKFWLDKGVDGFRMDAISCVYENIYYPDEPRSYLPFVTENDHDYLNHIYTQNQPEVFALVQDWRRLLDTYSTENHTRFMMCEPSGDLDTVMRFYGTKSNPGAHFPFNFQFIFTLGPGSNASSFSDTITSWYKQMPEGMWANWVIGNHDNPRPASRFDSNLIDGLNMLQMLLLGTPVVYNGDELGMVDTFLTWDQTLDPFGRSAGPNFYTSTSRDPERTPYQWSDAKYAGFTEGDHTWLPVNPNYWNLNACEESKSGTRPTHLQIFKLLVQLRKSILFRESNANIYILSEWVLCIVRTYKNGESYAVILNLGSDESISDLSVLYPSSPSNLIVLIPSVNSNYNIGDILTTTSIKLRPKAAVVLKTSAGNSPASNYILPYANRDDEYLVGTPNFFQYRFSGGPSGYQNNFYYRVG